MGVDKKILEQYVDACEMIRETEQDIKRLKRKRQTIVTGSVKGSMNDFPYAETHFKIEGTSFTYTDDRRETAGRKKSPVGRDQAAGGAVDERHTGTDSEDHSV